VAAASIRLHIQGQTKKGEVNASDPLQQGASLRESHHMWRLQRITRIAFLRAKKKSEPRILKSMLAAVIRRKKFHFAAPVRPHIVYRAS
jgi:hypothetical protein